ncbi:MAG: DNA helicase UvrD [Candidatus Aenigmatarchaeota archaeon]|nr:MAG: DNA helicase UvrD [Candidatus Aenigmarchaeota archaeon]
MRIFADLHIHSKYSRATSKDLSINNLVRYSRKKGINLLGTGDFTHPEWIKELKNSLEEDGSGILKTADGFSFVLSSEISSIYSEGGKIRKIHNVVFAPSFECAEQINSELEKRGVNLKADGRPICGISCPELVEIIKGVDERNHIIPAHVWTPWFGVFGSKSGFDSLEECFKDQLKHIFALETGLSSDPAMNWRLSKLDKYALISNSDAHSFWPWRIGREANVFELKSLSYDGLFRAIKERDKNKFLYTIEVDPGYGKYHFDGHRECGVVLSPKEAEKLNNICPVCGRPLTIGVLHRVEELADRKEGFVPKNSIPFKSLIPLSEIVSAFIGGQPFSKKVWEIYTDLIKKFGNELKVLLEAGEEELASVCREDIAKGIVMVRENKIRIVPGFDGVYGYPLLGKLKEREMKTETKRDKQKSLKEF